MEEARTAARKAAAPGRPAKVVAGVRIFSCVTSVVLRQMGFAMTLQRCTRRWKRAKREQGRREERERRILRQKALVTRRPFGELCAEFWEELSVNIQKSNGLMLLARAKPIARVGVDETL